MGSKQVKPEDILNLPQFTFGLHTRKRGFCPIRGRANALRDFTKRAGQAELKREMKERYGPKVAPPEEERPWAGPSPSPAPDGPEPGKPPGGGQWAGPEVGVI